MDGGMLKWLVSRWRIFWLLPLDSYLHDLYICLSFEHHPTKPPPTISYSNNPHLQPLVPDLPQNLPRPRAYRLPPTTNNNLHPTTPRLPNPPSPPIPPQPPKPRTIHHPENGQGYIRPLRECRESHTSPSYRYGRRSFDNATKSRMANSNDVWCGRVDPEVCAEELASWRCSSGCC